MEVVLGTYSVSIQVNDLHFQSTSRELLRLRTKPHMPPRTAAPNQLMYLYLLVFANYLSLSLPGRATCAILTQNHDLPS